jgi:hypothetical protein
MVGVFRWYSIRFKLYKTFLAFRLIIWNGKSWTFNNQQVDSDTRATQTIDLFT